MAAVKLDEVYNYKKVDRWFHIFFEGEKAGQINTTLEFKPSMTAIGNGFPTQ